MTSEQLTGKCGKRLLVLYVEVFKLHYTGSGILRVAKLGVHHSPQGKGPCSSTEERGASCAEVMEGRCEEGKSLMQVAGALLHIPCVEGGGQMQVEQGHSWGRRDVQLLCEEVAVTENPVPALPVYTDWSCGLPW